MFNLQQTHPSWQPILSQALAQMDQDYLRTLAQTPDWLPGANQIFNAFQLPLEKTRYILLGEGPYPRLQSANGYAFWDAAVREIWSETGFSKAVNRATSLRNFIKMLLVAAGRLSANDCNQAAIAQLDKAGYVTYLDELFTSLLRHGVLLLNATLVYSARPPRQEAQYWQPFMATLLGEVAQQNPCVELILMGKISETIAQLTQARSFKRYCFEHPYNVSFINNPAAHRLFNQFKLLAKHGKLKPYETD